jgi:uncharacterized membrane protein YfcA
MTSPSSTGAETAAPGRDLPWLRVVLVGVIAGFTSGLFGIGGGTVIVPALALVAAFPHKLATGTSLSAIVPISVSGAVGYAVAGEVDWAAAVLIATGALAGAIAGTHLLVRVPVATLQIAFAVLLLLTAVRMFVQEGDGPGRGELTVLAAAALVAVGLASGVLAGLLGVGGGILIVPLLTIAFGLPVAVAKGTSLLVIIPTAVMGTIRNRRTGLTALRPALVVGVAGIVTAALASQLSIGLDPELSAALFGGLLVLMAARLLRTGLAARRAAAPAGT